MVSSGHRIVEFSIPSLLRTDDHCMDYPYPHSCPGLPPSLGFGSNPISCPQHFLLNFENEDEIIHMRRDCVWEANTVVRRLLT